MKLTLVNVQTEEEINLDAENPVVIGRGPLFGCSDKRVSRNHGQIQLTPEGNVQLLALHTNPCFVMENGTPPVLRLLRDKEKILKDGDYIGLIPDSFWYKIVVKKDDIEDNSKSINICNFLKNGTEEKHDYVPEAERSKVLVNDNRKSLKTDEESQPTVSGIKNQGYSLTQQDVSEKFEMPSSDKLLADRLKELEKTKKLPLWMYEIDDFPDVSYKPKTVELTKENKTELDISKDNTENNSVQPVPLVENFQSCSQDKTSNEGKGTTDSEAIKPNGDLKRLDRINIASTSKEHTEQEKNTKNNQVNMVHDISEGQQRRPICQYEEKCYRKNETHRKECCHPGDPDFVAYENRPVCQYGSSCYRRNRSHHVEYQHPKNKNPTKNTTKDSPKRKRQEPTYRQSSEDDSYDLEDPFINDGSSDEYIPSGSNSEADSYS